MKVRLSQQWPKGPSMNVRSTYKKVHVAPTMLLFFQTILFPRKSFRKFAFVYVLIMSLSCSKDYHHCLWLKPTRKKFSNRFVYVPVNVLNSVTLKKWVSSYLIWTDDLLEKPGPDEWWLHVHIGMSASSK